jgi:hypothetical protein
VNGYIKGMIKPEDVHVYAIETVEPEDPPDKK